ncbi:MAG: DUF3876 domain-containing protein [Bacteroidales bacterium]
MRIDHKQTFLIAGCLLTLAILLLEGCSEPKRSRDLGKLCGNWVSISGKPDVLIYQEGEQYKLTLFKRLGVTRKVKPETYLIVQEGDNLFINTGFRIDIAYKEAMDMLTFSSHGDYIRANTNNKSKEK